MSAALEINAPRLESRLRDLGGERYGKIPGTDRGVNSLALSESSIQATIDVITEMEALGLKIQIDPLGNVFAVRPDKNGNFHDNIVLSGSHIDTVPTGGIYDGRLGVEGTLEVFRRLNEEDIQTDYPLACAIFLAEEGARYQPAMIGSRYFCGLMDEDTAKGVKSHIDGDNSILGEELEVFRAALEEAHRGPNPKLKHDYTAWSRIDLNRIRSYVELHIEQGPELEEHHMSVDAVDAVLGISQRAVTLAAENVKKTALAAFHIVHEVREIANLFRGEQRATVGVFEARKTEALPTPTSHQLHYHVEGETAHAGGGVMRYRHDAAYAAAVLGEKAGVICKKLGIEDKLAVGDIAVGLKAKDAKGTINVVPDTASFTIGLTNGTDQEWDALQTELAAASKDLEAPKRLPPAPTNSWIVAGWRKAKALALKHHHPGERVFIETSPAAPLTEVPSEMHLTVDLRNVTEETIDRADAHIETTFAELAEQQMHLQSARRQRIAPTPGNPFLINMIRGVKRTLGYAGELFLVLAAGHDFNNFAYTLWANHRIPAAMIAAASVDGVSHNVDEFTILDDLRKSGNVLLHTLLKLADARTILPEWKDPPPKPHTQTLEKEFGAALSRG